MVIVHLRFNPFSSQPLGFLSLSLFSHHDQLIRGFKVVGNSLRVVLLLGGKSSQGNNVGCF